MSTRKRKENTESALFKALYEGVKEELSEKQERLEIANYRVGQLETQVRNSIPMLEYHRENYEKLKFMGNKNSKNVAALINIMRKSGYCKKVEDCRYSRLSGDGSDRLFFRIKTADQNSFIGVMPGNGRSTKTDKGKAEALARADGHHCLNCPG